MALAPDDIAFMTALELRDAFASKVLSPVEVIDATLALQQRGEGALNSFVSLTPQLARDAARCAERQLVSGEALLPLQGLPLSVTDDIPVAGVRFTQGSHAFAERIADVDAAVVERLKAAGAAILGKTTLSEFGCKPLGDSPLTGATRNPWNPAKTPGGSSAGAAVSVAAGVTPFALCTDDGGAARIPAAFCGLFGLKPQFGRIPVSPLPGSPTLSHIGILARTVRDAAFLLSETAGHDARDPYSQVAAVPNYLAACDVPVEGMRVAWSPTLGCATPDEDVLRATESMAAALETAGCQVERVDDVLAEDPLAVWSAEFLASTATRLATIVQQSALLDPVVAQMLARVGEIPLREYWTQVFRRFELRDRLRRFFESYDLLLTPTTAFPAPDVPGDGPADGADPVTHTWSWQAYVCPFNLTGQPAASLPAGFSAQGMPIGVQLVSASHDEASLLRAAAALESLRPWADRRPPLPAGRRSAGG